MATQTNVSKTNQPVRQRFVSGRMLMFAGLVIILAVALGAVSMLAGAPAASTLPATNRSQDTAAARYQGQADVSVPLSLGPAAAYAIRYASMAEAYTTNKPVSVQAMDAWAARYAGMAQNAIYTPFSSRAIDAWAARYQTSYSQQRVSAAPVLSVISTSREPASLHSLDAWAARYVGLASSYVPKPVSYSFFPAWSARYTSMARADALQPALAAWSDRYAAMAGSRIVHTPVSQGALAAWSARYTGMAGSYLPER